MFMFRHEICAGIRKKEEQSMERLRRQKNSVKYLKKAIEKFNARGGKKKEKKEKIWKLRY